MGRVNETLVKALRNKKIGIDSSVLIYLFNGDKGKAGTIEKILGGSKKLVASSVLHLEIATGFYKSNQISLINLLEDLPKIFKNFSYENLDLYVSTMAAYLRAKYAFLKTPDSIHIATAIKTKMDYFLTSDKKLSKIREIPVKTL